MTRAKQARTTRIVDGTGAGREGVLVELRRGAVNIALSEIGDGYYSIEEIDPGQYNVFVSAIDTDETLAVGAGEVDRPDYKNNINSIMITDGVGDPQWSAGVPWSSITSTPTTITGYGITDAFSESAADAKYLPLAGGTITGALTVNGTINGVNVDLTGGLSADGNIEGLNGVFSGTVYLNGTTSGATEEVPTIYRPRSEFDVNTLIADGGVVTTAKDATNLPSSNWFNTLSVSHDDADYGGQLIWNMIGSEGMFYRRYSNAVFQDWQKVVSEDVNGDATITNNLDVTGNTKTNGATNFGRLASAPTANASGDYYYDTTDDVPYYWNGSTWLQFAEGDKPFIDLRTNLGVQHIITQANIDEDFKGWISSVAGDTNDFTLNSSTGVYTYNGPDGLKFDGVLSVGGTANTNNVNCTFKIYVDTGSGFQDVIQSHYPLEFDGGNERTGTQLTTAVLNNGDQLKVTIRADKLATLTFGYCRKHVREVS